MSDDPAPIGYVPPANDDSAFVVAHLVIYSSSSIEFEFTDELDHPEGHEWLRRRFQQAADALGTKEAREHSEVPGVKSF